MARQKHIKGVDEYRGQRRARLMVKGQPYEKLFPIETDDAEIEAWLAVTRKDAKGAVPVAETLDADVETYLAKPLIKAMPTYKRLARLLRWWVVQLKGETRSRLTVTADEIQAVLETALTTPTVMPDDPEERAKWRGRPSAPDGLAPATVLLRRNALQGFLTAMNGEQAPNPAKGICADALRPKQARQLEAHGVDYGILERIFAAMPTHRSTKKDPKTKIVLAPELSLAPIRARVMAYTSLPPSLIMKLLPHDLYGINAKNPTFYWPERLKGEGVPAHDEQLSERGVAALQAFHNANAYGEYEVDVVNRAVKRAAKRIGYLRHITQYYLRHSFGTLYYEQTRDSAATCRVMGLAEGSPVVARYTRGAHAAVDAAGLKAFDAAVDEAMHNALVLSPTPKPTRGQKAATRKAAAQPATPAAKLRRVK